MSEPQTTSRPPTAQRDNWQTTKKNWKDRMSVLFNSELLADVHFMVGKRSEDKRRIPGHKFVLSCGSPVFDAMFNGPLATSDTDIEVPDVHPEAFLNLLRFLYLDEVKFDAETVISTHYAAKKYDVPAVDEECSKFISQHLDVDNAFTILGQAVLFDDEKLIEKCYQLIDRRPLQAMASEGFTNINIRTLCQVLRRDSLQIRETDLFQAMIRWAEAECLRQGMTAGPSSGAENKRQVLGEAVNLIRFPLMSIRDFVAVVETHILTDSEVVPIFLYLNGKSDADIKCPVNPRVRFPLPTSTSPVFTFGKLTSP